ncbi:GDP-mannose 4,6-dehydratase [Pyrinomonas methylaliphatogenes]|uniref:UDP-glucose 4-epimerase n=1 Tax=Pyrinomonas methylaliphatogenes TaxID=454194 RepID=A0A0B6WZC5_9BACT|nr:GDP-mannose 4,6-dehydratase [Pyrinomonas methylaliphatogenes]MBX5479207.1 GDP-mannose 4,6-dehydratase [Pyrinomonas methylaliphatogenes]CDM66593.1 UDP-glucose 4-epimerase [Pyrinomonas methylaliphatogenes]
MLSSRRALITGGAGFIGSHLVDLLLKEGGWRVTVVDDFNDFYDPQIKRANIAAHIERDDFELIECDIRDREALRDLFFRERFDVIVHLAARAGVRPSLREPFLYTETNVTGTLNLLELARESGVRQFVFGSSSSVYGINAKVPFSEEDPIRQPISPYAATKAAGELLCHTYSHLYGIRCICLRFFTVYGARQRPDLAIHKFARLIAEGRPIPVFGDGTTRRDYTYIDDILQGVRAAMDYDASAYEIINLGEARTVELRELIALLERELNKRAIIDWQPPQPGDVPQTYADIAKARRLLGYDPQTPIEEGIRRFVAWFRAANRLSS